jgi:hypothetical protein
MWPSFLRRCVPAPPSVPAAAPFLADADELRVALEYMDELGTRTSTRIACVYEMSSEVTGKPAQALPLTGVYKYGSYEHHIVAAESLLPTPLVAIPSVQIGPENVTFELREVKTCWLVTPRGDTVLVLDGIVPGDTDAQQVAKILTMTCDKRRVLMVNGTPLLDWLRTEAIAAGLTVPTVLEFGQNVHHCVFPGGALLADIRARESFWRIINRVASPVEPTGQIVHFRPPELNYPGIAAVGHGRGVSVIAGFSEEVGDTDLLIAIMVITGLSVLRRSRVKLFSALGEANDAPATSAAAIAKTRALVTSLAEQLDQLQLDLEFGVESYLDSIIIPEAIIEAFQRSLCEATGLRAALEHSSRMLKGLASVIQARRMALDTLVQQQAERRDKVFSTTLAIVTLLAVPPTLLLAFFALNGSVQHSLHNLSAHGWVYAAVWGPFIVLVAGAWIARNFFKAKPEP